MWCGEEQLEQLEQGVASELAELKSRRRAGEPRAAEMKRRGSLCGAAARWTLDAGRCVRSEAN